jgi:hypothetical protein
MAKATPVTYIIINVIDKTTPVKQKSQSRYTKLHR